MANKAKSIKAATDQELDAILVRLRKESEAQHLVSNLIRNSTPRDPLSSYDYQPISVSTEEPIENLYHEDDGETDLTHFGVPGMRWGVRNKSRRAAQKYREGSEDYRKRVDIKRKKLHQMTNDEIKALNTRMGLEKQYKELRKMDISPGKRFVTSTLSSYGKTFANKIANRAVDAKMEKIFPDPKKKKAE